MIFGQRSSFIIVKWTNHLKRYDFIYTWTLLSFTFSLNSWIEYRSDIVTEHIYLTIELSAFGSLDKSLTFRSHVSQAYRSTDLIQELQMCPRLAREKLLLKTIGNRIYTVAASRFAGNISYVTEWSENLQLIVANVDVLYLWGWCNFLFPGNISDI